MIVELSYLIGDLNPVEMLGLLKPDIKWRARFGDGQGKSNQTSNIEMSSHNGTHIDAPFHVLENGKKITDFDISNFYFEKVLVIDCEKKDLEKIEINDLKPYEKNLKNIQLLLIYTGFSKYRFTETERYIKKSPGFSIESAKFIKNNFPNIRCIGVDLMGIENIIEGRESEWVIHKILFEGNSNYFHIEDMNVKPVADKEVKRVFIGPIRFIGLEASPVTIMAEI
ncbi:MAG: cyclase family protein [Actinomycetota bacterium]|nr:cyclase family protein [Actinomycetota bacterium]